MHLTIKQVCNAEYRAANRSLCPPVSQESAPRTVTAPRAVKTRGGTRNKLVWLQIGLALEDIRYDQYLRASAHMRSYGYGGAVNERKLRSMAINVIAWSA